MKIVETILTTSLAFLALACSLYIEEVAEGDHQNDVDTLIDDHKLAQAVFGEVEVVKVQEGDTEEEELDPEDEGEGGVSKDHQGDFMMEQDLLDEDEELTLEEYLYLLDYNGGEEQGEELIRLLSKNRQGRRGRNRGNNRKKNNRRGGNRYRYKYDYGYSGKKGGGYSGYGKKGGYYGGYSGSSGYGKKGGYSGYGKKGGYSSGYSSGDY